MQLRRKLPCAVPRTVFGPVEFAAAVASAVAGAIAVAVAAALMRAAARSAAAAMATAGVPWPPVDTSAVTQFTAADPAWTQARRPSQ